jgi:dipeptidyl aminopeptidase/acylaminoacyl peptidase
VTHLRQIMLEELRRRNYAESTIHVYIQTVEHFSRHFRRSPDQLGPIGAITYLCGQKDVDSHRLAILGDSYGGFLAALGLARASDALAAGVDYAGIYNWSTFLSSVGEPLDGDDANHRAVGSSPIATIDQWHSPVLLVQADDDHDVPHQTTELIEDLRSRNIDHDVVMIPNEIHVMVRYSSWMTLFNATDLYLDRHLHKRAVPTP